MDVFVSWRDITYEAFRSAGAGGIGKVTVALATNGPNKGVLFAVKAFSPGSRQKEDWKQAFMREVHILRDCSHPAIVKVFDEGVLGDGRPFFVMEYLPVTLWEAMKDQTLSESDKVSIVMQLLSALDYLSRRNRGASAASDRNWARPNRGRHRARGLRGRCGATAARRAARNALWRRRAVGGWTW
jgi:serine/threonine protein kinase